MPKVAATAATHSTTDTAATPATDAASSAAAATSGAAASSAAATTPAATTTTTASGLCGRVSGRDQHTRHANGGKKIDAEQRRCCQTARQEFPSSALFFPGHFVALPDTV
jgi:hypothetical protein